MRSKDRPITRVRYVSEETYDRLANTAVPGGDVYFDDKYLWIKRADGTLECYDIRGFKEEES